MKEPREKLIDELEDKLSILLGKMAEALLEQEELTLRQQVVIDSFIIDIMNSATVVNIDVKLKLKEHYEKMMNRLYIFKHDIEELVLKAKEQEK